MPSLSGSLRSGMLGIELQMLHRSVKAQPGQRILIHGGSGGVGSAMLQLSKLAGVEMYGTCSAHGAAIVRELGGIPMITRTRTS